MAEQTVSEWMAGLSTDILIQQGRQFAEASLARGHTATADCLNVLCDRLGALYYALPTPEKPAFPSEGSAPCLSDKPSGLVPDCRGFVSDPESSRTPREVEPL